MSRPVGAALVVTALSLLGCGQEGPTEPALPTLTIATASLDHAQPTVTYYAALQASGGDGSYTWAVSSGSLPAGLQLSSAGGAISGRSTVSGVSDFVMRVTSGDGQTASRQLSITVDPRCSELPAGAAITVADPALAGAIRGALGLGAQDAITCGPVLALKTLYAGNLGVETLLGMQHFTGLEELQVNDNEIADVSPVSGLVELRILVMGGNRVTDISLLAELGTALWDLDVGRNPVNNITALESLPGMSKLYVNATSVTDINPLRNLVELDDVDLDDNPSLSNIQALLQNTGIVSGDQVSLVNTGASCADIAILEGRGVTVHSDCGPALR